jgi:TonB family protein
MSCKSLALPLVAVLIALAEGQTGSSKVAAPRSCEVPANPGRDIKPPRIIDAPNPAYPLSASRTTQAQAVALCVVVGSDGKPCGPEIPHSPGPEFDRSALEAIKDWKWKPALQNGKPVAVRISVEMTFQNH